MPLIILIFTCLGATFAFNCELPTDCRIEVKKYSENELGNEQIRMAKNYYMIKCSVNKHFQFSYKEPVLHKQNEYCLLNTRKNNFTFSDTEIIEFKWPKTNGLQILDRTFNIEKALNYTRYFYYFTDLVFIGLKGFDINLWPKSSVILNSSVNLFFISCQFEIYINQKLIKSCADILESNSTIRSIFQIRLKRFLYAHAKVFLGSCQFKRPLCPLVFNDSSVQNFYLVNMVETFYKHNILTFTNDTFDYLKSSITYLQLTKVEGININTKLLNPSVFQSLTHLNVFGSVNSIDVELYPRLPNLRNIGIQAAHFRKTMHNTGIGWIKNLNTHLDVNLSDINITSLAEQLNINYFDIKLIYVLYERYLIDEALSDVFPDEDFCLYWDFPFQQLVVLMQFCSSDLIEQLIDSNFTCTFLWIVQYIDIYNALFDPVLEDEHLINNTQWIVFSNFYESKSKCQFDDRLSRCNKSNYQVRDIWSIFDYFILNKKLEVVIKVCSYLVCLFGIFTNLALLIALFYKENNDLFKEFKQYSYLSLNSIFCLIVLLIDVLSWLTECSYPFEVFCPEVHKFVFVQYFKIIGKECLVTVLQFMINFTYVAFAFNRIAMIDSNSKLVEFMSKVGMKKYIAVTLLISSGLSTVKYFKFDVNYDYPWMNYPISNEQDIFSKSFKKDHAILSDAFFIINSISDIVNYVIFVFICSAVDIDMIIILKKIMAEKTRKSEILFKGYEAKLESIRKENEEVVVKATRLVIINTAFGILLKSPVSVISIVNVYADYYYKSEVNRFTMPRFNRFYSFLIYSGFYGCVVDFANLLFIISISIQMFIYKRFDRKIQIAFERLMEKKKKSSDNVNKARK